MIRDGGQYARLRGRAAASIAFAVALCAAPAVAGKPSIRDVKQLDNGLFTVGMAHEIRKNCPHIEGRIFRAITFLRGLEREAYELGYTEDEIRRHLKSDAEKDRLRARAKRYMSARGLEQDAQGYCALGQSEIAEQSGIGALLRVTK